MKTFKFNDVPLPATTQTEAAEKLRYALVLARSFQPHELRRLAEVVEKDPLKVALAKKALGL
jgi:hypothetical protein